MRTCSCTVGKTQVPFSMDIGNVELMHECFPNTRAWEQQEWNKLKKQTKKERRGVSMERRKAGKKGKRSSDGLS